MIKKGTIVRVRTNNGGDITAPLWCDYRPTYSVTLDVNGRAVLIYVGRLVSVTPIEE